MSKTWSQVPLGEILTERQEVPSDSSLTRGEIPIVAKVGFDDGRIQLRPDGHTKTGMILIRPGDLVVSGINAAKGAIAIYGEENTRPIAATIHYGAYIPNKARVDISFLWWLLRSRTFKDLLLEYVPGGIKTELKAKRFLPIPIPLPPLVAEQRRIVARIDELGAKIAETRGLRRESAETTEMVLTAEEFNIWPEQSLRGSPTLNDVTTYLSRGRQSEQGESSHFLIKTQHVQMGKYLRTSLSLAPHVAAKVTSNAIAQPKDILIACSAAGCLGRVAFYDDSVRTASTDTHVAIARANNDVLPEYLFAYLRGAQGQIQLRSREKGDWTREKVGFRLTELNVADMRRVPIPLPSLKEQQCIVDYLEGLHTKVDALKKLQAETAAELNALLPSILDKAFKGQL